MEENFPNIEDFEFIRVLGQGSFGTVYHVREKKTQEELALKVFDQKKFKQSGIENEVSILSSLDHPNIVRLYKGIYTSQYYYITMEYLQGETLENFLKERVANHSFLKDEEASTIIRQLLFAVQYLHNKMVIHRDITLGNIMLAKKGDTSLIKLIDFGLSGQGTMENKTFTMTCGTPIFMAPEFYRCPNYSKMVDIWSCGIILYMVCNRCLHPFYNKGLTQADYFKHLKIIQEKKVFSEKFNRDACNLFLKMTAFEPSDRYTVEQAISHPWITRNFKENVPLTGVENIQAFQNSSQLVTIAKALFFLQFYKRITHIFKQDEGDSKHMDNKTNKENIKSGERVEKFKRKFVVSSISIPNQSTRSETSSPLLNRSPLITSKGASPSCEKVHKTNNNSFHFQLKMNPVINTPTINSTNGSQTNSANGVYPPLNGNSGCLTMTNNNGRSSANIQFSFDKSESLESPTKHSTHRHIIASRVSVTPLPSETERRLNNLDENIEDQILTPLSQSHHSQFRQNGARPTNRQSTLEIITKTGDNYTKKTVEKKNSLLPPIESPTRIDNKKNSRGKSFSKGEVLTRKNTNLFTSESQSPNNKSCVRQDEDEIYIKRVLENFREKAVNKRFVNLKDVYQILEKVEDKMSQQNKQGKSLYRGNNASSIPNLRPDIPENHGKDFRIRTTIAKNNSKPITKNEFTTNE